MIFKNFKNTALNIRKKIINIAAMSGSPHVGTCLSCVDILTSLYFYKLNLKSWDNRDIFILSKGHGAMALYCTLNEKGFLSDDELLGYYQNNGTLPAHLDRITSKYIEASAGSLGHGFNIGLGWAYGFKVQGSMLNVENAENRKREVFALIGDGETQEGSIWEGAMFAAKLGLNNFTAIIDRNDLQGYGRPSEICYFEPLEDKWRSFGWNVFRVNGHNFEELISALDEPHNGRPKIIIADTVKGKGVSFMENQLKWHYFIVTDEIRNKALKELESDE